MSKPSTPEEQESAFQAAQNGDLSFFTFLSGEQLQIVNNLRDEDSRSVLHVAAACGHAEVVHFLGSAAQDKEIVLNSQDDEGWTPLLSAVSSNREVVVKVLLSLGVDVRQTNRSLRTALHYAASKGRLSLIPLLTSHGALVNAKDEVGFTPLHRGASVGAYDVCERLIEEGANVDARDRQQQTPLMHAVMCEHDEVALLLVRHGADVQAQDNEEKNPVDMALSTKLRDALISAGQAMQEG